ncbi:MAG: Gfo/Idh/MocA family oxidoreductase [Candidatus Omnitrophica bacterium]|nr:Gfo/Idh/MocA family oxidoreductase [Candidatus Omnitrophota bacterium]
MKNEEIRVAIIGCGRIAGHHCRSIRDTEGVKLLAVCDLIQEKAAAYGKEFNVPYFTNYRQMLRDLPQINTVAVITPSGMHHEHAMEMLSLYKKNIIVEKPTFMRPSQLKEAYDLAQKFGLYVFPVFQNRYNLAVQRVRKALNNEELGKVRIVSVRVRWCRPQRYYDLAAWRGTYAQDGGALTNQGIHHVDLMRNLGGAVKKVNAVMRTLGADIEVEDSVVATVAYESGAMGVLEVTTAARPDDFEASISFVCEKGLAQIGGIAVNELQIFTPDPSACAAFSEDFSGCIYGNGHKEMYKDIGAFWYKDVPYPVGREDCLSTIKLLHSFYRADEEGASVDVDSDKESKRLGRADEELANLYRTPMI